MAYEGLRASREKICAGAATPETEIAPRKFRNGEFAGGFGNADGHKTSLSVARHQPIACKLRERGAGCRNGVKHVKCVGAHIESGMRKIRPQSGIVGGYDGVAQADIHGEEWTVVEVRYE